MCNLSPKVSTPPTINPVVPPPAPIAPERPQSAPVTQKQKNTRNNRNRLTIAPPTGTSVSSTGSGVNVNR